MEGFEQPPELLGELHLPEDPKQIFPRETRKGRCHVKGKDAGIWEIANNIVNNFGFKSEDQVNHLMTSHTTSLSSCYARAADTRENERSHARDDLAIGIG